MRRLVSLAIAALLLSPVAAQARAVAKPWPAMRLGVAASAPAGFADFCLRHLRDCAASPEQTSAADLAAVKTWASQTLWSAVFGQPGPASVSRDSVIPDAAQRRRLRIDASPTTTMDDAPAVARTASAQIDLAELDALNRTVNRSISAASDLVAFGRQDYWAAPEDGATRGDCEDYVLAKRAKLLERGVAGEALSIALVRTFRGDLHAVLLVATPNGEVVLDNLSSRVVPWNKTSYSWLLRQKAGSARNWVSVFPS